MNQTRIHPQDVFVLLALAQEDATVEDLARVLRRQPSDVRSSIRRLISEGLAHEVHSMLRLTEKGRRFRSFLVHNPAAMDHEPITGDIDKALDAAIAQLGAS